MIDELDETKKCPLSLDVFEDDLSDYGVVIHLAIEGFIYVRYDRN